jgi:RNA 2',3'-cyclic 3'-phosphodiesterase
VEVRRLFVCVDPSPDAVEHLGAVVDTLAVARANVEGHSTRLAARDRWHITLAFLGDVRVDRIDRAADALDRAWVGTEPPAVRFAGGGTFGRGRFAILWAGLDGDVAELRAAAQAVRRELRRARLPFDAKPFRPHLTLARPGERVGAAELEADVRTLQGYEGPPWTITEAHLVSSALGPRPVYTVVHRAGTGPVL